MKSLVKSRVDENMKQNLNTQCAAFKEKCGTEELGIIS